MRLGFDLDGTVADLQAALAREAAALFPDVDPSSLPRSLSPTAPSGDDRNTAQPSGAPPAATDTVLTAGMLSARQQRELWKAACNRANFWETLEEIEPGALARLWRLAGERRWEVIFLTSRPETAGDTAQMQSHRWLSSHGFPSPSVFVVHGSRGKIASALALEVLVDDRPENCLDVAIDSSARPILVWRGEEGKVPGSARQLGIGSVRSVAECLDILELVDRGEGENVGVIERLKRLLGLKPRAARLPGGAVGKSEVAVP
jgi:hypothetical protein